MKLSYRQVQVILVAKVAVDMHNEHIDNLVTKLMYTLGSDILGTMSHKDVRTFLEDFDATQC